MQKCPEENQMNTKEELSGLHEEEKGGLKKDQNTTLVASYDKNAGVIIQTVNLTEGSSMDFEKLREVPDKDENMDNVSSTKTTSTEQELRETSFKGEDEKLKISSSSEGIEMDCETKDTEDMKNMGQERICDGTKEACKSREIACPDNQKTEEATESRAGAKDELGSSLITAPMEETTPAKAGPDVGLNLEGNSSIACEEPSQETVELSKKMKDVASIEDEDKKTNLKSSFVKEDEDICFQKVDTLETSKNESETGMKDSVKKSQNEADTQNEILENIATADSNPSRTGKHDENPEPNADVSLRKRRESMRRESEDLTPTEALTMECRHEGVMVVADEDNIVTEEQHKTETPKDEEQSGESFMQKTEPEKEDMGIPLDAPIEDAPIEDAETITNIEEQIPVARSEEILEETRKDETSNADDINQKETQEAKNLSTSDLDEKTRSAEFEILNKNGNELYVTHPPVEEEFQVGGEKQDEVSISVSGHQVHEALEVPKEEEKHVNETYEASKSPENTLLDHISTEAAVNMEVTSTPSAVDINIEKGCELKSEEKLKEIDEQIINEETTQAYEDPKTDDMVEDTEKEMKNVEHTVRDTEKAILEQEDYANNFEGNTNKGVQIEKAPVELEAEDYSHGSEASETKSISTHTEKKRDVEDKELTSNLSNKTVKEVHPEDKKEAGSWLSQPHQTIKILETENMHADKEENLEVANVNVVNEGNVGAIEGEFFSKSTSVAIGKTRKNTEENQLITKEEMSGFQEEEEEQKGGIITEKNIIVEGSYGKNAGVIIQTADLTEGSSINIEKLREGYNKEENMDNASSTKTTSIELNSRETSFKGGHKTSNTSSNSMGTEMNPEKIQPSTTVEEENNMGGEMLCGGIKDVCISNETTYQDNPKAEEPPENSEGSENNLGSSLVNAPIEKISFTNVGPEACKNLEENSSTTCKEESEETVKLSEKMKGVAFIGDEIQNKNLESSFLEKAEEMCFQKVDNLETSKDESETGTKDIDNERQNEADDPNEILENITTAESNLSTPGKDDENPDRKADDSFMKPEESMTRESENITTTEVLTMECKHGGVMAVAGEDNGVAEEQDKTETSIYEEHSEQSFMQKTEPAKANLGSPLDGASEEIETTVHDECTETITTIEEQGPVGSPEEILGETRKDETIIAEDINSMREAKNLSTFDLDEKTRSAQFETQNENGNQDQFHEVLEVPKEEAKHVNETYEASKSPDSIILEHVSTEGEVNMEVTSTTGVMDIKLEKSCELNPEEKLEEINAKENVKEEVEQKEKASDTKFEIAPKSDDNEKSTIEENVPVKNSTSSCTGEEEYPHEKEDKIRPNSSKEASPELDSGDQSWRTSNEIKNINDQIIHEEVYEDLKIADRIEEENMKNEHTVTDRSPKSTGEQPTKCSQENEMEAKNRKAEIGEELETTTEGQVIEKQIWAEENRVQGWSTVSNREELDTESCKEDAMITEVTKEEVLEILQTANGSANIGIQTKEEAKENLVACDGEETKSECSYDEEKEEKEPDTLVPRETERAAESEIIKEQTIQEKSCTMELHIIPVADETVNEATILDATPTLSLEETASNKNTEIMESIIAEDINKESEAFPMTKELEEEIKKVGKPMDILSSVSEGSEEKIKEENRKDTENCDDETDMAPTVVTEVPSLGEVQLNDDPVKALHTSPDTKSLQTTKTADTSQHDAKVESMKLEETSSMVSQLPVHEPGKADTKSITVKKSAANDVEVEETKILEAVSKSNDQSAEEFNERSRSLTVGETRTYETEKQIREGPEELSEAINQGVEAVSEDEIIALKVAREASSFGEVHLNDEPVKALDTSSGGKNLETTKTADTSQQNAEVDSVKLVESSNMFPQLPIPEHEKAYNENITIEKSDTNGVEVEEAKIPDAASESKDQAVEEIHETGTSLTVAETDSDEIGKQIREVPNTLLEPINQGVDAARDDEITPGQTLQAEKIEEQVQVPSSCLLSEEQESEIEPGIEKEKANGDAWVEDQQELYRLPEMINQKGISESDVGLLKRVNTSEVANCSEIGKLDTLEDEKSSYIGLESGCINTEKAIQEQEHSDRNFEGSSKESIEIEKAPVEFEAEGHSHGNGDSETKSISITLTEKESKRVEHDEKLRSAPLFMAEDKSNRRFPESNQTNSEEESYDDDNQTTNSIKDQISGQDIEEGKMKMLDETEPKLETQKEINKTQDAILTEKVPGETERAAESEIIKEQTMEEESCTKELHIIPVADETVNESLQETASNKNTEMVELKIVEDPNKESEASPMTKALEEEIKKVGKPVDVSSSVSEGSEEKIKEENIEDTENCDDKTDIAPTVVTEVTSLGEVQLNDELVKALDTSPETKSLQTTKTADYSQQVAKVDSMKHEETSSMVSQIPVHEPEKADTKSITTKKSAVNDVEVEENKILEAVSETKDQSVEEFDERSANLIVGENHTNETEKQIQEVPEELSEAINQGIEAVSEDEIIAPTVAREVTSLGEVQLNDELVDSIDTSFGGKNLETTKTADTSQQDTEVDSVKLGETSIMVSQLPIHEHEKAYNENITVEKSDTNGVEVEEVFELKHEEKSKEINFQNIEGVEQKEKASDAEFQTATKSDDNEKHTIEEDVPVKNRTPLCTGEDEYYHNQEEKIRPDSSNEAPELDSGEQSSRTFNQINNINDQIRNEEIGEELETPSEGQGVEKQVQEEENRVKDWSTVFVKEELDTERSKEYAMMTKMSEEEVLETLQTAGGCANIGIQTKDEDDATKDNFAACGGEEAKNECSYEEDKKGTETDTVVLETNYGDQATAEKVVTISVRDQLVKSFEEKTVQESSQEDEASEESETFGASTTIKESGNTGHPSSSVGEEKVKESLKEDKRDAMGSEKEVWNSNIECIESDFDATHSTEERKAKDQKDEAEPNEDLNNQSITGSSSEEAAQKEINLDLVENSSMPEKSEEEVKREILEKENVTVVAEETSLAEAEAKYITQADSSNLVSEEKGLVTTETSETGLNGIDIIAKPAKISILSDSKDMENPTARKHGADEAAEKTKPEGNNETCDTISETEDQRDIATVETSLDQREIATVETSMDHISEQNLLTSSTLSFEEHNSVTEVNIMEKEDGHTNPRNDNNLQSIDAKMESSKDDAWVEHQELYAPPELNNEKSISEPDVKLLKRVDTGEVANCEEIGKLETSEDENEKPSYIGLEKDKSDNEMAANEASKDVELCGECIGTEKAVLEQEDSAINFESSSKESVQIEEAPVEFEAEGHSHGSEASETKRISTHAEKKRDVEDQELTSNLSNQGSPDLTEGSSMDIEQLRENSNKVDNMGNALSTKTTSIELNLPETSFEGEHKTSNTSTNSRGSEMDPEKMQPNIDVEDEKNKGEEMLNGGIKDVCMSNETTCQDNPKAEERTEFSEDAKDNLGSSLVNEPVEETSFTKVRPEVCKNPEENSSTACEEENEETVKLSQKLKSVASIEDDVQNMNLKSSFLKKIEEMGLQKVDNLEISKEESETGMKDIDNERQNEADGPNEILEDITTDESNLSTVSTPGKDDENLERKADDSFRKPEEIMTREDEDIIPTEALTMECKHEGVMAVAGEDNIVAEEQDKTETSKHEEHSEQSFMQKTEPAKANLGSPLDVASEEIETTVPNECTEPITNNDEQRPVGSPEEILGEARKDERIMGNDTNKEIREAKNLSTVDLDEKTRSAEFEIQNKNAIQLYVTHLPIEEKVQVGGDNEDEVSMSESGDQFHEVLEVPKEEAKHVNETYEASKSPESIILEHVSSEGEVNMEVTSTTGAMDIKLEKSCELNPEEKLEEINAKENVKEEVEQKEKASDTKFEIATKSDDNEKSTIEEDIIIKNITSSCTGEEEYSHDHEDKIRPNSSTDASPELDNGDQSWRTSNEAIQVNEDPMISARVEDTAKRMEKEHTVTDHSPEFTGEHTTSCSQENETEAENCKAESGEELETTSEGQGTEIQVQAEENRVQDWSTISSVEELDGESSKKDDMITEVSKEEVLEIIQTADGSAKIAIQTKEEDGTAKDNFVACGGEETKNECSYDEEKKEKEPDTPASDGYETARASTPMGECAITDLPFSSDGEERGVESLKQDKRDAMRSEKEVWNLNKECTEQVLDTTPSTEEREANALMDEAEPNEGLNPQSIPTSSEDETTQKESILDLVKNSSSELEISEKEIKNEILEKEDSKITVVPEETSLPEAESEYITRVDSSNLDLEEKGQVTTETGEMGSSGIDIVPKPTEISILGKSEEMENPIARKHGAEEAPEKTADGSADIGIQTKEEDGTAKDNFVACGGEETKNECSYDEEQEEKEPDTPVPRETERASESEIIKEQAREEQNCTKEVHMIPAADETVNEVTILDVTPIQSFEETASNKNTEMMESKIVEDLNKESEASPMTKALEEEIKKVGNPMDVSSSVYEGSEEKITEEDIEDTENCDDETDIAPTVVTEVTSLGEVQLNDEPVKSLDTSSDSQSLQATKTTDTSQHDAQVDSMKLEETSSIVSQHPVHELEKEDNKSITVRKTAANDVEVEETKILDAVSESKDQSAEDFNERSLNVGETCTNETEKQSREVPEELSEAINQGVEAVTEDEIIAPTVVREVSSLGEVQLNDEHVQALDTSSGGKNPETTKTTDNSQQGAEVDSVKLEEISIMVSQLPIHEHEKEYNENIIVEKSDTNGVEVEETKIPDAASESKDQAAREIHDTGPSLTVGETDSNEIEKQIREIPYTLSETINQGVDAARDDEISPSQTLQAEKIEEQLKLPSSCLLSKEQESETAPGIEKTKDGSTKKDSTEAGNLKLEENSAMVSQLQITECDSANNTIANQSDAHEVELKETEAFDAVSESKDQGLEEIHEIRTSLTSKYTETYKIEDEIKGVREKISDPRYQGFDAAADGEILDHPLPVGKVEEQLQVSPSALFFNILESETRSTIGKIEDESTKKDGTEVGKIELEEATGIPTTEHEICNMSATTEKSGSDEVQVEETKTSEAISESKGHDAEEIHVIGPNPTVGKTHIDKAKVDIKAVPGTIFDPNNQGVEAVIDADITINQTLTTQGKEQLQEPSSALLKEQKHETTTKVEIIKDESTKKDETQLTENVVGSFATSPTEKPCLQDEGPRELEVSNLELEVQKVIQNRSAEEESTALEKASTAEPQEYSPEIKYADSQTEYEKRPTQCSSQENSTDEVIIYSENSNKDGDNITPYPTVKELLTGEAGEKCEEASNLEFEKTGRVLESVPEISSPEVPQLKGAITELRDEKNHYETTEADEAMNKYTSKEKISEEKKVSKNSQPASPQEESITKSNQEDDLREEDYLGDRTIITLETPRNEIQQKLESEEAGSDRSREVVTADDRTTKDPCQVSVGDGIANTNLQEEAKDGKNIENAPNNLELGNQADETYFRDMEAATKAAAPIEESTKVMLVSHEEDRTSDNDEETVMSKDEPLKNTDLAVPPVTDAAAKEVRDEKVGEIFDEFSKPGPKGPTHETIETNDENIEIATADTNNSESVVDNEKLEHTYLEPACEGSGVTEDSNQKKQEVCTNEPSILCSRATTQEKIADKESEKTVDKKQHDFMSDKHIIEAVRGKGDEELVELSTIGKERKHDEAKVQRTIAANEDEETQEQNEKPNVLSHIKASGTDVSHELGIMDIANVTQVTKDTQGLEKTSLAISHEQIASNTDPNESVETTNSTASKDLPLMQDDKTAKAFRKIEVEDLKAGYASGSEPEAKGIEGGGEKRMGKEYEETTENSTMIKSAKISLSDLPQRSTKQTFQGVEHLTEERELTGNKEEPQPETAETFQVEEAKTDEEEEGDELKKEDSGSDAPVMVESSKDMDVKIAHKKSHNILSGVGSKVKHSLAKVKKAITGKSSHPKPPSAK